MSDSSALEFQAPAAEDLAPLFPHFEILDLIACGGMGAVYRARQASLDRIVAIKILPPELGADAEYAKRFQEEARLMANLSNPHIVTVFDFGLAGSYLYFVMEYVDGKTLHEILTESGSMRLDACLRTMAEVCRGLDYAHGKGLVHLDIKPANIMINRDGEARVLDFGLAKLLDPKKGSATETMGTPDYAAPERTADGAKVDHRADIYSLGIMFYELLTGKIPRGLFKPASQVAGVDPGVDAIITKCTRQNSADRFQKAREIFGALVRLRRNAARNKRGGVVTGAGSGHPGLAGSKAPSHAAAAYQQMMAGKGSKAWIGWAVAAVAACVIVVVVMMSGVFGGGDEQGGAGDGGGVVVVDPGTEKPPGKEPDKAVKPDVDPGGGEGGSVDPPGTPDGWNKGKTPFPPDGLEEEIARIREAMADGMPLDELAMEHLKVFEGRVYYMIPRRLGWGEAESFAGARGAHLATVTSGEEEEFVRDTWFDLESEGRGSRPVWIGGKLGEDGWSWVSGEQWDYDGWADGVVVEVEPDDEVAAVLHEASWVIRSRDVAYSALIEWDPPKKVVSTHPVPDPEIPKPPSRPLTALEKLRKGFEERIRSDVVEYRETAVRDLGAKYLSALEGLWQRSSTVPLRAALVADEIVRFQAKRTPPESADSWPGLGRLQNVLISEFRRIDKEAVENRLKLIRTYGDALLALQADFTSKAEWDQVKLAKEERERIEALKRETGFATVRATPKGLEELVELFEPDKVMRFVTATPDGARYLVSGMDEKFRLYSAGSGELELEWDAGHTLGRCAFLPGDDRFVALDPGGHFEIWSLNQQVALFSDEEKAGRPVRLAVSPRGDACVVGLTTFKPPKEPGLAGVRPWAISDPPVKGKFQSRGGGSWAAFSPDGQHLALSTKKGLILLVYGDTEPVWANGDGRGEAVKFSADGKMVVCGRILVDAVTGDTLTDLRATEPRRFLDDEEARRAMVYSIALDGDGIHGFFGLYGGGIEIWNLQTSTKIFEEADAHSSVVTETELSGDGGRLATSDVNGQVMLWKVER